MAKWIISIIAASGYGGIILLMFIENLVPPIPSEFIMPLAGYMVSLGEFSLIPVIIVGTLGSVIGTLPLFYIGRRISGEKLVDLADRYGRWLAFTPRDVYRSKRWFERYGDKAILFGRLIPGIRAFITIPAAMCGIRLTTFLLYTTISSLVWTAVLTYAGYILGSEFTSLKKYMDLILILVIALILAVYIVRVLRINKYHNSGK